MDIVVPFKGRTLIFCEEGYALFTSRSWYISGPPGYAGYLRRKNRDTMKNEQFHNALMGNPPEGLVWDHINCDTFDNRKSNLRLITKAQNNRNKRKLKPSSSKYIGVSKHSNKSGWNMVITKDGKIITKYFKDEEEAARARDALARELFGEYCQLNFPAMP